jgi:hypothetical protein
MDLIHRGHWGIGINSHRDILHNQNQARSE